MGHHRSGEICLTIFKTMGAWSQVLVLIITLLQTVHVIAAQVLARLDVNAIGDALLGGLSVLTGAWQEMIALIRS